MKVYRFLIATAIRYRKAIEWADTHRYDTVDMMFFYGLILAVGGMMLLFGSANTIWIGAAALGVIMIILSSNPQAISMAISIAVKSLNTMHHDSMSVNFVRFVHTFPLPHNAT